MINVEEALKEKKSQTDGGKKYLELLHEMKTCSDVDKLLIILQNISNSAPFLTENHEHFKELLGLLFSFEWEVTDERLMNGFESILIALVSCNAGFLQESFSLIVRNLSKDALLIEEDEGIEEEEELSQEDKDQEENRKQVRFTHLHETIRRILRVNPLGCSTLLNTLIEGFPQRNSNVTFLTEYAKQALKIAEYVPVLRDRLLEIYVERLIDLDVALSFTMDDLKQQQQQHVGMNLKLNENDLEISRKVDAILSVLLEYFDEISQKKSTYQTFKTILDIFEKLVLRTSKAKVSQFFIFYFCKNKQTYTDAFISLLLDRITDVREAMVVRKNSANFLGSFLARAKYLKPESLKIALNRANEWLCEESKRTIKKNRKGIFDALFQAVIYCIIFKRNIVGGVSYLNTLPGWKELCESELSPLSKLSKDIAEEFSNILAEENDSSPTKRQQLIETSNLEMDDQEDILEKKNIIFDFPFDPIDEMILDVTSKKVDPFYQHWIEETFEDVDAENEESKEDDENEEEDDEFADKDLLNTSALPKAIRIEQLKRKLGMELESTFPSPQLRPSNTVSTTGRPPSTRPRSISMVSVDTHASW